MNGYNGSRAGRRLAIELNTSHYRRLVVARGWWTQEQQAQGLGLGQATISRLLEPGTCPGPHTIAAVLAAFPDQTFNDLFNIVAEDEEPLGRSA